LIPLAGYLSVSAILFAIGAYGLITKRNAMRLVFAVEILLGAANLNFITFNTYFWPAGVLGQTVVLFSIALGASEAAVLLAIIIVAYRLHHNVDVSELKSLEG
jgi:NADH-quinone oxidoreductase subunit K